MSEWFVNNGRMPAFCKGKRIYIELRGGLRPESTWPADGREGCNWRLHDDNRPSRLFDIIRFRLA